MDDFEKNTTVRNQHFLTCLVQVVAGMLAGGIGQFMASPTDLIKTQIQVHPISEFPTDFQCTYFAIGKYETGGLIDDNLSYRVAIYNNSQVFFFFFKIHNCPSLKIHKAKKILRGKKNIITLFWEFFQSIYLSFQRMEEDLTRSIQTSYLAKHVLSIRTFCLFRWRLKAFIQMYLNYLPIYLSENYNT